jgi:hypothetical protein
VLKTSAAERVASIVAHAAEHSQLWLLQKRRVLLQITKASTLFQQGVKQIHLQ